MPEARKPTLLFLENREKTALYAAVARMLERKGVSVAWLVQNPAFGKGLPGRTITLPFPAPTSSKIGPQALGLVVADRGRRFFGSGDGHYAHYRAAIAEALDIVAPDLVVGESTLFHELLTIEECAARAIPFVHPAAERYPNKRFVLFTGATQIPYVESGDHWADEEVSAYVARIAAGIETPRYMKKGGQLERLGKRLKWALTRSRVWWGRLQGEIYNTPSLAAKVALARKTDQNIDRWRNVSRWPDRGLQWLLYPMQMEPETNIDTWGHPWNDQVDVVRRMVSACPPGYGVAIKSNPKPKYEMSDALLAFAELEPRICLLPFDANMNQARAETIGTVTVSGTVGYEAIFGNGRCISLRHPVLNTVLSEFCAATPEEAVERLVADPQAGRAFAGAGESLVIRLVARSFSGLVSDSFSDPACLSSDNSALIANGLLVALEKALGDAARTTVGEAA